MTRLNISGLPQFHEGMHCELCFEPFLLAVQRNCLQSIFLSSGLPN
jgi:hypothetical protein